MPSVLPFHKHYLAHHLVSQSDPQLSAPMRGGLVGLPHPWAKGYSKAISTVSIDIYMPFAYTLYSYFLISSSPTHRVQHHTHKHPRILYHLYHPLHLVPEPQTVFSEMRCFHPHSFPSRKQSCSRIPSPIKCINLPRILPAPLPPPSSPCVPRHCSSEVRRHNVLKKGTHYRLKLLCIPMPTITAASIGLRRTAFFGCNIY